MIAAVSSIQELLVMRCEFSIPLYMQAQVGGQVCARIVVVYWFTRFLVRQVQDPAMPTLNVDIRD